MRTHAHDLDIGYITLGTVKKVRYISDVSICTGTTRAHCTAACSHALIDTICVWDMRATDFSCVAGLGAAHGESTLQKFLIRW